MANSVTESSRLAKTSLNISYIRFIMLICHAIIHISLRNKHHKKALCINVWVILGHILRGPVARMSAPLAAVLLVLPSVWTALDNAGLGIQAIDEPRLDVALGLAIGESHQIGAQSTQLIPQR
ncbi:MAG: hypothetical protein ACYC9J_06160 [Sulfuricaulis sp.]